MDIGAITNGNTARKHRIRIAHAIAEKNGAEENIPLVVCVVVIRLLRKKINRRERERERIDEIKKGGTRSRLDDDDDREREEKPFSILSLFMCARVCVIP